MSSEGLRIAAEVVDATVARTVDDPGHADPGEGPSLLHGPPQARSGAVRSSAPRRGRPGPPHERARGASRSGGRASRDRLPSAANRRRSARRDRGHGAAHRPRRWEVAPGGAETGSADRSTRPRRCRSSGGRTPSVASVIRPRWLRATPTARNSGAIQPAPDAETESVSRELLDRGDPLRRRQGGAVGQDQDARAEDRCAGSPRRGRRGSRGGRGSDLPIPRHRRAGSRCGRGPRGRRDRRLPRPERSPGRSHGEDWGPMVRTTIPSFMQGSLCEGCRSATKPTPSPA